MGLHPIADRIAGVVIGAGRARVLNPQRWPAVRVEIASALSGPFAAEALDAIAVIVGVLHREGAERTARVLVEVVVETLEGARAPGPAPETQRRFRAFAGAELTAAQRPAMQGSAPAAGVISAARLAPPRALR